jgi:hypothetical protein
MQGPPCPWCQCTDWSVEHEDIVPGKVYTSYDPDNGPIYFARCDRCSAQGPIVGWAADAIRVLSVKTKDEFLNFSKESDE